jgi:hypothetical protein
MPATPSRIGFITQEFRVATAGPNTTVSALYGSAARDTAEPLESYFDDVADAQAMADERLTLLAARRSLVTVSLDSIDQVAALDRQLALPTVRVIDDEQNRNSQALIVGFAIDMNNRRATLETWG